MQRRVSLMVVLVLVVGAIMSFAQEKVDFVYKYKQGETLYMLCSFKGQMELQMPGMGAQGLPPSFPLDYLLLVSAKTLKTYEDGSADIEYRVEDGQITMMGQTSPLPAQASQQAVRLRIGPKGNVLKIITMPSTTQGFVGVDPQSILQGMTQMAVYPEQAVAVGDKWERKGEFNLPPLGKLSLVVQGQFAGMESVDKKTYPKLVFTIPPTPINLQIPIGAFAGGVGEQAESSVLILQGEMEAKTAQLFDTQIGKPFQDNGALKMKMNITIPPQLAQQGGPSQISMNMNLQYIIKYSLNKKPPLKHPEQPKQ